MSYTFNQTTAELQEAADAGQALYEGIGIPESDGTGNITFRSVDNTPTSGSNNLITSDAVNDALEDLDNDYQALVPTATEDDIAIFNAAGQVKDSSKKLSDYLATAGGTMSGAINMGSNKITSLADGTNDTDAINKGQLDNALIDSMITDTASGAIASFPDGANAVPVKSLIGYINPLQDLHGYDNPWPAGGGKNKVNVADRSGIRNQTVILQPTTLPAGTYMLSGYISNLGSAGVNMRILKNGTSSSSTSVVESSTPTRVSVSFSVADTDVIGIAVAGSAAGYNASVSKVMVEEGSSMTDFAPYSNICPISGFTGMDVDVVGKNMFDANSSVAGYISNSTGDVYGATGDNNCSDYIPVRGNTAYKIVSSQTTGKWGAFYDDSKTYISGIAGNDYDGFTTPANAKYVRFTVNYSGDNTSFANNVMLILNGESSTFEPFKGSANYPISWQTEAGAVYGGYVNPITGVLTVTWHGIDAGTKEWGYSENGYFYASITGSFEKKAGNFNILCSIFATTTSTTTSGMSDMEIKGGPTNSNIFVKDSSYTDADAFTAAMSGVQLVYELATPITYQLTPTQVETLLGQNNIWVDTNGNVNVEYRADTKLYIDKKLGA